MHYGYRKLIIEYLPSDMTKYYCLRPCNRKLGMETSERECKVCGRRTQEETGNTCYERIQWSDEKEHGLIPTDFKLAIPKIFRADQISLQGIREYGKDRRTHTPPVRSLATAFLSLLSFATPPFPHPPPSPSVFSSSTESFFHKSIKQRRLTNKEANTRADKCPSI